MHDNEFFPLAVFFLAVSCAVLTTCGATAWRDLRRLWRGPANRAGRLVAGGCLRRMP